MLQYALLRRRHVEEHQQHAGDHQNEEEKGGDGPEPETVSPAEAPLVDLGGKPVQPEILDDRRTGFPLARRVPGPRDPTPQACQPIAHARAPFAVPTSLRCSYDRKAIRGGHALGGVHHQEAVTRQAQRVPRQRARRRPGKALAVGLELASMARAIELRAFSLPLHGAAEMRADGRDDVKLVALANDEEPMRWERRSRPRDTAPVCRA